MAITGDRHIATYEGHTIELIRNNWVKTLTLKIDDETAASQSCILFGSNTLTAALRHNGAQHTVVARSVPRNFLWTTDTIKIDGKKLTLTKTR